MRQQGKLELQELTYIQELLIFSGVTTALSLCKKNKSSYLDTHIKVFMGECTMSGMCLRISHLTPRKKRHGEIDKTRLTKH